MPDDFKSRLQAEEIDLRDKVSKLMRFLCGDQFTALPVEQRGLLSAQVAAMQAYQAILVARMRLLDVGQLVDDYLAAGDRINSKGVQTNG